MIGIRFGARSLFALLLVTAGLAATRADAPDATQPLPRSVNFEQFAKAPGYSEGPTWRQGELFFCSGALLRVTKDRRVERHLDINPAGTVLCGDGRLIVCDNKHKALLELTPDGQLGVIADACDGQPLRSLNDVTIDGRGNLYWTDPEGSSVQNPVGAVLRVRPDGVVTRIATGLAFPNGIDVNPASKHLFVIESQSKKVLRYELPTDDQPLGKPTMFYDLGGSGGDGCTFDAAGNLWVADFHRPETGRGRITVLTPEAKLAAQFDIPAKVVSNITFGGDKQDEIFCTTGDPPGVIRAKVGVAGFAGHPGRLMKLVRRLPIAPEQPASNVHPRRFGFPGGPGRTRGWYVWDKFDPATRLAEVRNESSGQKYTTRVLPWATTYRHLAYGATVEELLPGERVNLFFDPDESQPRGYLVHFQDELCQMKGHGHAWQIVAVESDTRFTARVMAGDKPLDDKTLAFTIDSKCQRWHGGRLVETLPLAPGDRVFLTWVYRDDRRVAMLITDDASLEPIKSAEQQRIATRIASDGLGAFLEAADGRTVRGFIVATFWAQAGQLKDGQTVWLKGRTEAPTSGGGGNPSAGVAVQATLASHKNIGTYGSGPTEFTLEIAESDSVEQLKPWIGGRMIQMLLESPSR